MDFEFQQTVVDYFNKKDTKHVKNIFEFKKLDTILDEDTDGFDPLWIRKEFEFITGNRYDVKPKYVNIDRERFYNFMDRFHIQELGENNKFKGSLYVSGSSTKLLWTHNDELEDKIGDIDIFIDNVNDLEIISKFYIDKEFECIRSTNNIVEFKHKDYKTSIQIINSDNFNENLKHSIAGFDFRYLCIYLDVTGDGELYINNEAINSLIYKTVIIPSNYNRGRLTKHVIHDNMSVCTFEEDSKVYSFYSGMLSSDYNKNKKKQKVDDEKKKKLLYKKHRFNKKYSRYKFLRQCKTCGTFFNTYEKTNNIVFNRMKCKDCIFQFTKVSRLDDKVKCNHLLKSLYMKHKYRFSKVPNIGFKAIGKYRNDLYEEIVQTNDLMKKIYIDIDIAVISKFSIEKKKEFLLDIILKIQKKLPKHTPDGLKFYVYDASRFGKESFHIIGSDHLLYNSIYDIKELVGEISKNIDMSVYKSRSLYRLPYVLKNNTKGSQFHYFGTYKITGPKGFEFCFESMEEETLKDMLVQVFHNDIPTYAVQILSKIDKKSENALKLTKEDISQKSKKEIEEMLESLLGIN